MPKPERNIRYKPGSDKPYILHVQRGKRGRWKKLRDRPSDLDQAKDLADTIARHEKRRPVLVKITDPTDKQVLYLVALAGRPSRRPERKTT